MKIQTPKTDALVAKIDGNLGCDQWTMIVDHARETERMVYSLGSALRDVLPPFAAYALPGDRRDAHNAGLLALSEYHQWKGARS